jgi:CubicO group peptidase (beta-lactamase class C family)
VTLHYRRRKPVACIVAVALSPWLSSPARAAGADVRPPRLAVGASLALPLATPESQGMSRPRLERMHAELRRFVDEGRHSGLVTLVARNGRVVDLYSYGKRDLASGAPMDQDTIFRVYSMSKLVTSVAALMLLEEGRLRLNDPVKGYLPELAQMKVWIGGTAARPLLADALKPITVEHLLTHSSGLIYGQGDAPIDRLYKDAGADTLASTAELLDRVAQLPLAHEPGSKWSYGLSTDVLGALVEKLSGQSLGAFCEERIFRPLRMADTGFSVPEAKRSRIATIYEKGEDGGLKPAKPLLAIRPEPGPKLEWGGAGLFSTTGDYARFMQMLLNGGQLDGVRLLSRKTVELMTANHIAHLEKPTIDADGSLGFGLGGSVRVDLARGELPGSVGEFGWSGAATTRARIDPKERLLTLVFAQHFPGDEHGLYARFATLVYAAIAD